MSSFSWDDLKVFLAAYRSRSLRKAAVSLGLGLSTVSRRIAALEQAAGVPLFSRTAEGLMPTAAAEAIVEAAEQTERLAAGIDKTLGGLSGEVEGLVRIASMGDVTSTVIVPFLQDLLAPHPRLTVELLVGPHFSDLERFEADLAIRTKRPEEGENLVVQKLRGVELRLFASRDYVEAMGRRPLTEHRWIANATAQSHFASEQARLAVAADAAVAVRVNDLRTGKDAAVAGLGVVFLPETMGRVAPGLVELSLDEYAPELPRMTGALWLVGHRATRQTPRVRAVWDFIRSILDEDNFDDPIASLRQRLTQTYGWSFE